jgi:hypothetical protein
MVITKADSVLSTQRSTALIIPPQLAEQEDRRQVALMTLARLRREAFKEVTRLIAFLDATDEYVMTELEPSIGGDDREDDDEREHDDPGEEDGTAEPSLGSLEVHPSPYGFERDRDGIKPSGAQAAALTWRTTTTPASAI